jgi:predicted secreted protein
MSPEKPFVIGAAVLALLMSRAEAQPAPQGNSTLVHLPATGTVQASPDELVADLVAQATSPSAAAAQRRVNTLIDTGMKTASGETSLDSRAIDYLVNPVDDKHTAWSAPQTLELRGSDGPSLLDLAGKLQGSGFVMNSLDWRLSPALRRKAHDEATTMALKELMARAKATASTLGLQVDHIQQVTLNPPSYQPRPPFPMMAMAARAMPAPQATAAPEDVTAEVSADYVLKP